jgi:hypothetical protein
MKIGVTMNKTTALHAHRSTMPVFLILGALLLIASACTTPAATSPGVAQPTSASQAAAPTSASAPTVASAPVSARDVNSMNACALYPGDVLASAIGTTLTDPTNKGAGIATQCTYSFGPAGTGNGTDLIYNLFLMPPELYTPSLSGMMNSQSVSGMGDMASMGTRAGTSINDLMVLKTGDIFVEVNGADPAILQKLAGYVLAHLP